MPQDPRSLNHRLVARFVPVERWEVAPVCWAAAAFGCLLASHFILRALRDLVATETGAANVPWLWSGTFVLTIAANAGYLALVQRMPRRRFITLSLLGIAAVQLLLMGAYHWTEQGSHPQLVIGYLFYAWLSTFNLLVTCLAWVVFVDVFSEPRARRLFGFIAAGGTVGALLSSLPPTLGVTQPLILFSGSVLLLFGGWACLHRLQGFEGLLEREEEAPSSPQVVASGGFFAGLRAVRGNPVLVGIFWLMVLMSMSLTALYLVQSDLLREVVPDRDERHEVLGLVNTLRQAVVLALQVFLAGNLMRRRGVGLGLGSVPVVMILGFAGLALAPGLVFLLGFMVLRDGVRHGLGNPARQVLFTTLTAEEKYKAKAFTDTVTFRGADVLWAFVLAWVLAQLGISGLLWALVPACLVWLFVTVRLARLHRR